MPAVPGREPKSKYLSEVLFRYPNTVVFDLNPYVIVTVFIESNAQNLFFGFAVSKGILCVAYQVHQDLQHFLSVDANIAKFSMLVYQLNPASFQTGIIDLYCSSTNSSRDVGISTLETLAYDCCILNDFFGVLDALGQGLEFLNNFCLLFCLFESLFVLDQQNADILSTHVSFLSLLKHMRRSITYLSGINNSLPTLSDILTTNPA